MRFTIKPVGLNEHGNLVVDIASDIGTIRVKKFQILGERNPRWKGGQIVKKDGRVMIRRLDASTSEKYIYRYRAVVEAAIGRRLKSSEIVHHINGCPWDDRIENLRLMENREHSIMHWSGLPWAKSFSHCVSCGTDNTPHKGHGLCRKCYDQNRWPRRKKTNELHNFKSSAVIG